MVVGGKGAQLGELSKFVTVPNAFCVSVNCYAQFLTDNNLLNEVQRVLLGLDVDNTKDLNARAKLIQELILSKPLPFTLQNLIKQYYADLGASKVAVRSSSTAEDLSSASFAGQQDTYLNVSGAENVIKAVQACWASLFTSRAIYYRSKKGFENAAVLMGVVVQEMVKPLYSGVMFTRDPLHKKDVLIEVVEGFGDKLVSGEVTPNSYFVSRNRVKVLQEKEFFQLEVQIIKELTKLGQKIEAHYGTPQDVEWSVDASGSIFVLQSRPITV
ncbi:MAG: hypothetical protein GOV15_00840 [Candidatus Diapherotrites archaeon]|nr:hypothetical protein [Candidatus Diapherotrites archaeon]